ncbi:MAG: response regulator transcription factor [Acidobacteriales bacterium]|nr:response regulator transcription factor [Terriglobales bacterium]
MLKIILADNQAIFRAGAAKVLAVEDDFRIVAQCETPEKTRTAVESFRGAVLLVSTSIAPDLGATVAQAQAVGTRVIAIGEPGDTPAGYLAVGATGFVQRNVSGKALVECVRKVSRGEVWSQDTQAPGESPESDIIGARVRDRLTAKELRMIALIVQGFKNREIADQLGTTEQVVKNYLRTVYDKIGVSDRLELALFTIHHRILAEAASAMATGAGAASNAGPRDTALASAIND